MLIGNSYCEINWGVPVFAYPACLGAAFIYAKTNEWFSMVYYEGSGETMYALAPKRDGGFLKDISIKMKYKNGKISIQRHGDEEQYVVNRGVAELRLYKTNGWTKESEAYLYFTKVRDATPELTAQIKNAEVWRK